MKVFEDERIDDIGFGDLKLIQNPKAFCYGVDAVILADFAASHSTKIETVADLGTGSGIIPLILSHKTDAERITGFEVQENQYEIACRNAEGNNLSDRIEFINSNVKDIQPPYEGKYDVVTMNPPYMESGRGLVNTADSKMIARHELLGTLEDFMRAAKFLLKDKGELFIVHRPSRLVDLFSIGRKLRLEPKLLRMVTPKKGEIPNIVLIQMVKYGGRELRILPELNIYEDDGGYSEEVLEIYER